MANPIVTDCPIIGYYDKQRFRQLSPADTANWYLVGDEIGKKKMAMYPTMGRKHINYLSQNRLIFDSQPRLIIDSINFWYSVVGDKIFQIDNFFNIIEVTASQKLNTLAGNVFFTYIIVNAGGTSGSVAGISFACFTDGKNFYLLNEQTKEFGIVTDSNLPKNPLYIANFGNRVTVSTHLSSTFGLSEINLHYNASFATMLSTCFTINGAAIFAQEAGIINQMAVFQNNLYIFTDFTTGVWSNIVSIFTSFGGTETTFPWKKNTTYSFDYGISENCANTLSTDFGMLCWASQDKDGIIQPMLTTGGKPQEFSSKAINVLLQRETNAEQNDINIGGLQYGFLYDYENTIFYRLSSGPYNGTELLDQINISKSIEYNFETQTWHRCIELNGERNRIQDHIFVGNRHLVTVIGESTVYQMSGEYYTNENRNPDQADPQAADAYSIFPFRYERITPIIVAGNINNFKAPGYYAEFKTNYLEIDFVWGEGTSINSTAPFDNAVYLIDEQTDSNSNPIYLVDDQNTDTFLIAEEGNYPVSNSDHYYNWFKPSIELWFSNDGGISFDSAGQLEFSQIGIFQWRMRWYQLGCSRNRVYKLVCVSVSPIVVLGASMEVENVSGGSA